VLESEVNDMVTGLEIKKYLEKNPWSTVDQLVHMHYGDYADKNKYNCYEAIASELFYLIANREIICKPYKPRHIMCVFKLNDIDKYQIQYINEGYYCTKCEDHSCYFENKLEADECEFAKTPRS
jgi:hypothetical protein